MIKRGQILAEAQHIEALAACKPTPDIEEDWEAQLQAEHDVPLTEVERRNVILVSAIITNGSAHQRGAMSLSSKGGMRKTGTVPCRA